MATTATAVKIRPLHDRVIVQRLDEGEQKVGGIIIPDSAKEKPQQAEVVAVGSGRVLEDGKTAPLTVKAGDRIAVEAQHLGGIADAAFRALQRTGDEHLLELPPGFLVEHTLLEQFLYELVQLIAHGQRSLRPDNRAKASTYFSRVRWMTSSGSDGTGGCLFHRISSR